MAPRIEWRVNLAHMWSRPSKCELLSPPPRRGSDVIKIPRRCRDRAVPELLADGPDVHAGAIEEARGEWFVASEIATRSAPPWLVALMAVEFLAGCGLVRGEGVGHRLRAAEGLSPEAALAELTVAQIRAKEA